jgi:Tol biopolymer transport system component
MLGPYEIHAAIGAGAMGEVYRARDRRLDRDVAIKSLPQQFAADPERLARFEREAKVLASLSHPNIAAIYGLEEAAGAKYLVLEYIAGESLAERLKKGALPNHETLAIARQIGSALEAAHEKGIIHRDLKPANIMLTRDGQVKVLDFGLARIADTGGESASASMTVLDTRAGVILGTPGYMSPENVKGQAADARSDIWAFGVIVAEMASGKNPFGGDSAAEMLASVLTREPDLDAIPAPFRRLVGLCLAKDPRGRLRHIGDAFAVVDDRLPAVPARRHTRVRSLWGAMTFVLLAAATGVAISWAVRPRRVASEPITKFYVDPPPGGSFNYTYTATAISPNGRQLVFRVATATEAPALWLRPLDALEGNRLASTDGADFPFWSQDGRFVGFFAAGKLKRVDTNGGTPIVICDASDADTTLAGASWNADGVIVFGAPEGLYRVSASSGVPVLFAPINPSAGETGYGAPQFLPDGDRFLMFVRTEDRDQTGYYVSSLSRPQLKTRVLATRSKAIFVPDQDGDKAYLLYLQNRTVLARTVDQRTFRFSGEPVPLVSEVARFPPGFHASVWSSASANLLAYRAEASDKPRLTWLYPDGKRQPMTGTEDFFQHVRVAPSGSRAAVELADATGNLDIWTWDFERQVKMRQTFDPKPDRAPTWSPDGRELAFSSLRTGVWQLFRKDVSRGQPEEQLTNTPGDKILPEWSRDGRYLLYIQISATTAEDIWALPLQGDRRPFAILNTPAIETNPALSPDGRWLAFESSQSGRPEIYVTPFPRSADAVDAAAPRWQVSTQGGSRPHWSSDGRALFYVSLDESGIVRVEIHARDSGLESEAPRVFAEIPVMPSARSPFDVAADGRVLVMERTINRSAPLTIVTNWRSMMNGR